MNNIPLQWHFAESKNSWTTNELGIMWVEQIFHPHATPSLPSAWRLLILDGHSLHTSMEFLDSLWSHCIIPFLLPSHPTHLMQLLDVLIFGPLTAAYNWLVNNVAAHVGSKMDKSNFSIIYAQAWARVITQAAAQKALSDSGMTTSPDPEKVLNQLPGYAAARAALMQEQQLQNNTILQSSTEVNRAFDIFQDSKAKTSRSQTLK